MLLVTQKSQASSVQFSFLLRNKYVDTTCYPQTKIIFICEDTFILSVYVFLFYWLH